MPQPGLASAGVAGTLVHGLCSEAGAACAGLVHEDAHGAAVSAGDPVLAARIAGGAVVANARRRAGGCLYGEAGEPGCPPGLGLVAAARVPEPAGRGEAVLFAGLRSYRPGSTIAVLLPAYAAAVGRRLAQLTVAWPDAPPSEDEAVLITDERLADRPIVHACRAWSRLTGYPAGEVVGRNPRLLQGDDRDQPGRWRLQGALERGGPVSARLRNYRRDGTSFPAILELEPVRGDGADVTHWIGLLRRSDALGIQRRAGDPVTAESLHALERSPVGKVVVDRLTGAIRFANRAVGRILGCHPTRLNGRGTALARPRDGRVRLQTGCVDDAVEAEMICRSTRWGDRPAWLVTLFEVTSEPGVPRDAVSGAPLLDRYPHPLVWSRPDGSIAHVTQETADLLGYSRDELSALTAGRLDAGGLVDGEAWARNWAFVRMQGSVTIETRLRRRDGWTLPAVLDVQHIEHEGRESHLVLIRATSAA